MKTEESQAFTITINVERNQRLAEVRKTAAMSQDMEQGDSLSKIGGSVVLLACIWQNLSFLCHRVQILSLIMAATSLAEKDAYPTTYAPLKSTVHSYFNPLSPFHNVYSRFARWRADLGLPQPGSVENLQKEVKGIVLSVVCSSFTHFLHSYPSHKLSIRWSSC